MTTDDSYQRDQLYEEVWTEPVVAVAKKYGVSDVAIHKACKRLQVPVPPRGYWARLRAGQPVTQDPLPPYEGRKCIVRPNSQPSKHTPASSESKNSTFMTEEERNKVMAACQEFTVKDRLTNPHPLILQDKEVRQERKQKEREEKYAVSTWNRPDYDYWNRSARKMLDISVEPGNLQRGYRLFNALFSTIEALGGTVKQDAEHGFTQIVIFGEAIRIRLSSRDNLFAFTVDDYQAPRKNWRDGKTKRLETEMGSMVISLFECAHILRTQRENRRREEQLRLEREIARLELEEKQREEIKRFAELENSAFDWQEARMIEDYVTELERQAENESDPDKRLKSAAYISWAKEKIAWLDPLVEHDDPILGERKRTHKVTSNRNDHSEYLHIDRPWYYRYRR